MLFCCVVVLFASFVSFVSFVSFGQVVLKTWDGLIVRYMGGWRIAFLKQFYKRFIDHKNKNYYNNEEFLILSIMKDKRKSIELKITTLTHSLTHVHALSLFRHTRVSITLCELHLNTISPHIQMNFIFYLHLHTREFFTQLYGFNFLFKIYTQRHIYIHKYKCIYIYTWKFDFIKS